MDPTLLSAGLLETFNKYGLTELTGLFITIAAMSSSFYFLKGLIWPIIGSIWAKLKELTFYEIQIHISDPDFQKFNSWLNDNNQYTWFQRTYKVVNENDTGEYGLDNDESETTADSQLSPGYGTVLIKAPKQPFILVTRIKEEKSNVFKETSSLHFKIFSLNKGTIASFFKTVVAVERDKNPTVYSHKNNWWRPLGKTKSVLEPLGAPAWELISDVENFLNSEQEYRDRGMSYKRGYLLHGMPGTGKTSLIAYLSRKFKMNIYSLSSLSISTFEECAGDIKPRSIILIEDIDMTVAGVSRDLTVEEVLGGEEENKDKKDNIPMTDIALKEMMRGFLNTLDGITEFEGNIVIATTNQKNILDEALLRPGRIDKHIEIYPFTYVEQIQHINRFYKIAVDPEDYTHVEDRTFAVLQDMCVNNLKDHDALLKIL